MKDKVFIIICVIYLFSICVFAAGGFKMLFPGNWEWYFGIYAIVGVVLGYIYEIKYKRK